MKVLIQLSQHTSENNLQLAKRRAEREAADFKQKSLKFVLYLDMVGVKSNMIAFTASKER